MMNTHHTTHIVLCLYNAYVCQLEVFVECDLDAEAKAKVPQGAPYFIVEKAMRDTLPDKDWQKVTLDWANPHGYGERVMDDQQV